MLVKLQKVIALCIFRVLEFRNGAGSVMKLDGKVSRRVGGCYIPAKEGRKEGRTLTFEPPQMDHVM